MNKKCAFGKAWAIFVVLLIPNFTFANPMACMSVICLSNLPGLIPSECASARQAYFIYQVWSPYYNPPATSALRLTYLMTCPVIPSTATTYESAIEAIQEKYGELMIDPQV